MTDKFIFVFLDDRTLDVVSPNENLIGVYEGIDVEEGVFTFFDHDFHRLDAHFTEQNRRGRSFCISWVSSGKYELVAGERDREAFQNKLNQVVHVNSNKWFKTVDDIYLYIEQQRV